MPKRIALMASVALAVCMPAFASPPAGWPADQINLTLTGTAGAAFDGTYAFPWDDQQGIYWRELPPSYDTPVLYGNIQPTHSIFELYGIIANDTDADTPWGSGTVTLVNSHPMFSDWSGTGQFAGASVGASPSVPEPSSIMAEIIVAGTLARRRRKLK